VFGLSNGAIFNDFERPTMAQHYLTDWRSQKRSEIQTFYNGLLS